MGHHLLAQVEELYNSTPPALPPDEVELRRNWSKMLERIATGDIKAHYRRAWLLHTLLEN